MVKQKIFLWFLFLFVNLAQSQELKTDDLKIFKAIEFADFKTADSLLLSNNQDEYKEDLLVYKAYFQNSYTFKSDQDLETNITARHRVVKLLNSAIFSYRNKGEILSSYKTLREALDLSMRQNYDDLSFIISLQILEIYSKTVLGSNDISYKYVIKKMKSVSKETWQENLIAYYDFKIYMRYFYKDSLGVISTKYKDFKTNDDISNPFLKAKINATFSNYHNRITKNIDSSYHYLNLAKAYFKKNLSRIEKDNLLMINISEASLLYQQQQYEQSLKILLNTKIEVGNHIHKTASIYYNYYKTLNYRALKQENEALLSQINYLKAINDQNESQKLQVVSELETKYQTAEKEKQLLVETQKKEQNRNIAFGLGGSLALGSVIVFLVYKNKKRKQELILQNKEIKEKELTAKLKEQELASINAMIEGQEKERLRIANDLHDDLGSHMATIKMYFSSFKDQDSKNLFDKTNNLIEEAYQKIRNIAHTKNSGVLAKQGLLKAVKDLARNISKSEQVDVKVHDNGLDQRLENSLELTLFRIIQELIANVIKHADATEVDIHLSEDEGMLSIMVEDNGKGFDASQITTKNKGLGLSSIDRRVEDLDGKMIIESQPNSGTSIIIDLPLL